MSILSIQNVVKQYHNHTAVNNISFEVPKGKIFGLLGPNGAGKTSLIRIITKITKADSGAVLLDGHPYDKYTPEDIGYMPEERGLYKNMEVGAHLLYLAELKGMSKTEAKKNIKYWFDKFEIQSWWNKKVEELSKGMQQKIQFVATVIHRPKLLILDEPFSGLDPINTNLIKDEIYQLNKAGTSIIFSTHRMEQVEEICQDIVLINNGEIVLEGNVERVKQSYKLHRYRVEYYQDSMPSGLDTRFNVIRNTGQELELQVSPDQDSNSLLRELLNSGLHIKSFKEILPSINDIFIRRVGETKKI